MAENLSSADAGGRTTVVPTVASAVSTAGPAAVPAPRPGYPQPSSAGRSANMRANRRADTKPELALRRALHGLGFRYRKDYRLDLADGVRGRPDNAFTPRKGAAFADWRFWACCPEHGSPP